MTDDTSKLTQLGSDTKYKYEEPNESILEIFPNRYPNREYVAEYYTEEFTSLCPKTGQPDFAKIRIKYIPYHSCVETKSLKLYLFAFRQYGSFMESITGKILEDFVSVCDPRWCQVTGDFASRGGIAIRVCYEHGKLPFHLRHNHG